jgi:hypothetical protein
MHHLNSNDILVYGFRNDLLINKATYKLTHKILQTLNNKSDYLNFLLSC